MGDSWGRFFGWFGWRNLQPRLLQCGWKPHVVRDVISLIAFSTSVMLPSIMICCSYRILGPSVCVGSGCILICTFCLSQMICMRLPPLPMIFPTSRELTMSLCVVLAGCWVPGAVGVYVGGP